MLFLWIWMPLSDSFQLGHSWFCKISIISAFSSVFYRLKNPRLLILPYTESLINLQSFLVPITFSNFILSFWDGKMRTTLQYWSSRAFYHSGFYLWFFGFFLFCFVFSFPWFVPYCFPHNSVLFAFLHWSWCSSTMDGTLISLLISNM